jgi:hypothetical protein
MYCQLRVSTLPTEETECGLLPTITASFGERGGMLNPESNHDTEKAYYQLNQKGMLPTPKLLKTPSAMDAYSENLSKKEQKFGNSGTLAQEVATGFIYERGMLPTPATRDYKGGNSMKHLTREEINKDGKIKDNHINQLPNYIKLETGTTSQLNPLFVAEMMGFPISWLTSPFLNGGTNP